MEIFVYFRIKFKKKTMRYAQFILEKNIVPKAGDRLQ